MCTCCVSCKRYKFIDLVILFRFIVLRWLSSTPTWSSRGLAITASSVSTLTAPWTLWITNACTYGNSKFFRNFDDEWDTCLLFTLLKIMLNESNSHCYLRYPEHGPTTDINTFNATALLILFRYAIDYNTKLIYHWCRLIIFKRVRMSNDLEIFSSHAL